MRRRRRAGQKGRGADLAGDEGLIADIASLIATASYQTIGVFFGIGLCLNICGFGYRMTTTEIGIPTVEVKPLAEMRKEIRDERWKAQFMADEIPGL